MRWIRVIHRPTFASPSSFSRIEDLTYSTTDSLRILHLESQATLVRRMPHLDTLLLKRPFVSRPTVDILLPCYHVVIHVS